MLQLYEDAKIRRMNQEERLQKVSTEQDSQTKSKKVMGHSLKLILRKIDKVYLYITYFINTLYMKYAFSKLINKNKNRFFARSHFINKNRTCKE